MSSSHTSEKQYAQETTLVLEGRSYSEHGVVNPAVYRASTILHPSVAALSDGSQPYSYGRYGTPTTHALREAVCSLEGGYKTHLAPSGMAAISATFLAFLKPGDHLLVTDAVYHPVRRLCAGLLKGFGVETTYYPPLLGEEIASYLKPSTKMIWLESPGSHTMEIQNISGIVKAAKERGVLTAIDNTWGAGGYLLQPLKLGCDLSIQATTKYLSGHADVMMGAVTVQREEVWKTFDHFHHEFGLYTSPDDAYLCLRGIRTLDVRLKRHMENTLVVASWLEKQPEVEKVFYPALPSHPQHALWQKDFSGACGLFSFVLREGFSQSSCEAFINGLSLFGIGYSWGGFESLALPFVPERVVTAWPYKGYGVRVHVGLENPQDLIADLKNGFLRLQR